MTTHRNTPSPQKGRRSQLLIAVVMLLTGTTLTVLGLATGNTTMIPLFIIMSLTFALHALTLYAGWGDDRSGSPTRYYASRGILVAGALALIFLFALTFV